MDKINVFKALKELIGKGEVTKSELINLYTDAAKTDVVRTVEKQSKISEILYFIGGVIVFAGICVFVGSNWRDLNNFTKILSTLGAFISMYFGGVLIGQYKELTKVAESFYFLAALVAPL